MPIKQSAKKAAKQAVKRRAVNVVYKDAMKLAYKNVIKAADNQSNDMAQLIVIAQKAIDKASKKNIISKESGSRKKGIIMKLYNNVTQGSHVAQVKSPTKSKTTKKTATKKTTAAKKSVSSPRKVTK